MNTDAASPGTSRSNNPTTSLLKNQAHEKSESKQKQSSSVTTRNSPIAHRKASAIPQPPLAATQVTVDTNLATLGAALLYFDKKRHFTQAEKKLCQDETDRLRQENPEFSKLLEGQYEPEIPFQFKALMELEDFIGKSGLSGKEKRKEKAKAISYACRETQKIESRNSKKTMGMAVGICTRLVLDEQWLKLVKEKNRSGQHEQALCDVNELLCIIGKLKTRHSFLPDIESKALREKMSISVKLRCWTEVTSALELMIRKHPEQSYTKDLLFLATIYLSRVLHGSIEDDLKLHFNPEKAFACIMECLQCKSAKFELFYKKYPEYRYHP